MSEPKAVAQQVEEVVPGIWHWSIHDERIDFVGAAHAISGPGGTVLVDPLPLEPEPFSRLGRVEAIVLTCGSHQRSSWRLRGELEAPVWAPALSRQLEDEPDYRYGDGDLLPGGLLAIFTPGAGTTQHTLLLQRDPSVAFVPDLLVFPPGGALGLVADRYLHDPAEARRSVRRLLELEFDVLCLGHGTPLRDDPKAAIQAVVAGW